MMHALLTWFDMGGYAAYIWPAYGAVMVVLMTHVFQTRAARKRTLRKLRSWVGTSA
ncbi:MAG: heme exporter protein CcmD [Legionellaceae bacterium]|nr:heme exporter protein CcmD [Legionellaceae bacterium]